MRFGGDVGNLWKAATKPGIGQALGNMGRAGGFYASAGRDAGLAGRIAGGGRMMRRNGLKVGLGAGLVLGAYGVGRSSGANRNGVVGPSTGIYGV